MSAPVAMLTPDQILPKILAKKLDEKDIDTVVDFTTLTTASAIDVIKSLAKALIVIQDRNDKFDAAEQLHANIKTNVAAFDPKKPTYGGMLNSLQTFATNFDKSDTIDLTPVDTSIKKEMASLSTAQNAAQAFIASAKNVSDIDTFVSAAVSILDPTIAPIDPAHAATVFAEENLKMKFDEQLQKIKDVASADAAIEQMVLLAGSKTPPTKIGSLMPTVVQKDLELDSLPTTADKVFAFRIAFSIDENTAKEWVRETGWAKIKAAAAKNGWNLKY